MELEFFDCRYFHRSHQRGYFNDADQENQVILALGEGARM
jgi:hypothetical protein